MTYIGIWCSIDEEEEEEDENNNNKAGWDDGERMKLMGRDGMVAMQCYSATVVSEQWKRGQYSTVQYSTVQCSSGRWRKFDSRILVYPVTELKYDIIQYIGSIQYSTVGK